MEAGALRLQKNPSLEREVVFQHCDANPLIAQLGAQGKFNAFFAEFHQYFVRSQTALLTELYAPEGLALYIIRVDVRASLEVLTRLCQFIDNLDQHFAIGLEDMRRLKLQRTRIDYRWQQWQGEVR